MKLKVSDELNEKEIVFEKRNIFSLLFLDWIILFPTS